MSEDDLRRDFEKIKQMQPWPDLRGFVVDDCEGDDGLFLDKVITYNETCASSGATLSAHYSKKAWYGACIFFLVYANLPFEADTQIVFCKHTLW